MRIKLQDQPFQVLALLLERPGEVVSREELRQKLWAADTFVDFDVGLNSAVKRLRDALGDTAEEPRFIETLPRRGYRFVASVEEEVSTFPGSKSSSDMPVQMQRPATAEGEPAVLPPGPPVVFRRSSSVRWVVVATAFVILALAVFETLQYRVFDKLRTHPYTIAVLPFRNLSPEPDRDYFSDGLTSEIIRNLSAIDGLEVRSQTSSFAFKDKSPKVRDVGAQLAVKLVLEGSVRRLGDKLRISTQLVRVSDDVPIWSGNFDRELKDVFAIQDEISRSIVNQLRLKLGSGQRRYNMDVETYDLYLQADTLATLHSDQLAKSIDLFESAIARDPEFAPAYAGLAIAYADISINPRVFSADAAYPKMRAAAEKALQLDPLLPEAYDAMGLVYARDQKWKQAEAAFRRSLQLNPGVSRTHADFGVWVLFPQGRMDEAVQQLHIALRFDPLSMSVRNGLTWVLLSARKYDEVLKSCAGVPWDPNNMQIRHMYQVCGRALVQMGKLRDGIVILERDEANSPGFLGYAYAKVGRRSEAERLATKYSARIWQEALIYAGLGDKERAFELLRQMADQHQPMLGPYLTYPEFDSLRGDPRFNQLREQLMQPLNR
ncbi:MAG: winged helix-turn-helix domain-containing protein [Acidobacteria bacterium]|nr:winged helix-turn-helix domain-containing protein [Acidobacteriota bacterium]MBV9437186.1 winged helix-turn-helix domain-containing protein [Acidobacteriota bacterium]